MLSPRLLLAIFAAATVFWLTSGSFSGHNSSYAQENQGSPSQAQLETSAPEGAGARRSCKDIEESKGGLLLGRIVPCLLKTIQTSGSRMSRDMIEMFRPLFFSFLTFVMVMFGLQVLQNEGQLQARAFVLLLKIGFCMAILNMIPGDERTGEGGLIGVAYGIMAETQASVMSTLGPESSPNITCRMELYGDENTPAIWKHMDCLLGKLYGFTVGTNASDGSARPNMLLATSLVGLLSGFFFGGSFGVALFLAAIGVLVSMFVLILRVLVAYVNSYMFIALYMILAPLLLPLMFLKVTTSIFEKWYSGIIAALLLPMVITAYVVLALQMYDRAFFAPDALINQLYNSEFMRQAQENPRPVCDRSVTNNPDFRAQVTGQSQQQLYTSNPFMTNFVNPLTAGANNLCGGISRTVLNLQGMRADGGPENTQREAFKKLFQEMIQLGVLTILVSLGFKKIMDVTRAMLGSGAVVGAMDAGSPQEQKFKDAMRSAREGFQGSFNSQGGTAFLGQIPTAVGNAGSGFLRGMGLDTSPSNPAQQTPPGSSATRGAPAAGAAGNTGGAAGSGGSSGGSGGSGGDDGPDGNAGGGGSGGGSGGGTARGGPAAGAPRQSIRSAPAAERAAEAERVLGGEATRFAELDQMFERGDLPRDLEEEYARLIARIDQAGG